MIFVWQTKHRIQIAITIRYRYKYVGLLFINQFINPLFR